MVKLKHHACARWPSAKKGSIDGTGGQGLVAIRKQEQKLTSKASSPIDAPTWAVKKDLMSGKSFKLNSKFDYFVV